MPDGPAGRGGQIGTNYGGRIQWDGAFSIANVPPGRYMLRARGDDGDTPQFGLQPVSLTGMDVDDMIVVLSNGATLTGTIAFLPGARLNARSRRRCASPPRPPISRRSAALSRPRGSTRTDASRWSACRPARISSGRAATCAGGASSRSRSTAATSPTRRSNCAARRTVANVAIVLTDKLSEINGKVTDQQDVPVPDVTVLVFSTDPAVWRPQSRHIMTARPDQTGQYRVRGLPAGDYYVATVDPTEQGEWFEPAYLDEQRIDAVRVTLSEGDVKTKDFTVSLK